MAKTKTRVHREHIRPVGLSGRKSCPSCGSKLAVPQWWSWGEYHNAKWRTVQHFCQLCYATDVERKLVTHALQCGCTFELVGHGLPNNELPGWIQLPPMDLTGMPTMEQCVKLVGPPAEWKGRCAEVAARIAAAYLNDKGFPRYGAWHGDAHPQSFFASRRGLAFIRHGWFELKDGRVFDPTRWVFEGAEPYLYVGRSEMYDAGMARAKALVANYREAPKFDPAKPVVNLSKITNDDFRAVAGTYFGGDPLDDVNVEQIFYLANLPPQMMPGPARIRGVYEVIVKAGYKAAIPADYQEMFLKPVTAREALAAVGIDQPEV